MDTRKIIRIGVLAALGTVPPWQAAAQDWPYRGGDPGGRRFSTLTEITPANVATLERAWVFDAGATSLQVTPIVVDGVMYIGVGSDVVALEPETSRVIWRFTAPATVSRRGIAYWPGDGETGPRLFTGSGDRMLTDRSPIRCRRSCGATRPSTA